MSQPARAATIESNRTDPIRRPAPVEERLGATYWASLDAMIPEVDIVSLHTPHTRDTFHILSAERLGRMRRDAYVVNVSRPELIDEEALAEDEASLQHLTEHGRAADRDGLQQILRRLGDLTAEEAEARVAEGYSAGSMLENLISERRAVKVRINGEERFIAAEDAGRRRLHPGTTDSADSADAADSADRDEMYGAVEAEPAPLEQA